MNRVILLFLAVLASFSLFSQSKSSEFLFGGNAGLVSPTGKFAKIAAYGFGANAMGRFILNEQIAIGVESGFAEFGQDRDFWYGGNIGMYDVKFQLVPVLLDAIYIIRAWDKDFKPYASLAFGYYFYRNRVDFTSASSTPHPYNANPSILYVIKQNKVGLAPTFGFMYILSKYLTFDMSARYTRIPDFPEFLTVSQKLTNTSSGSDNVREITNFKHFFTDFSSLSLSVGLFYRF